VILLDIRGAHTPLILNRIYIYDTRCGDMVSLSIKHDMLKLIAFVEGPEYLKGHPHDEAIKALAEALKNFAQDKAVAGTLAVIKTALGRGAQVGWLMGVLLEHQDDDKFKDAIALCERIFDALKFITADCGGFDGDFVGQWKGLPPVAIGDDCTDPIFLELDKFSVLMVDLSSYMIFLERELPPASEVRADMDELKKTIAELPPAHQLIKWEVDMHAKTITWFYNESYDVLRVTAPVNRFSRSGLLSLLYIVEQQLKKCQNSCIKSREIRQDQLYNLDSLYDACLAACLEWKTQAQKALQNVDLSSAVTAREVGRKAPLSKRKRSPGTQETHVARGDVLSLLAQLRHVVLEA